MATDCGVLYYNLNTKCIVRLMTSIYALRKHYSGPVALIHDGEPLPELADFCRHHRVSIHEHDKTGQYALVRKASLWRVTPFRYTIFLDADTLPLTDPSPLFHHARRHRFVVHHFCNWKSRGSKVAGRIRNWSPVIGADGLRQGDQHRRIRVRPGVYRLPRALGANHPGRVREELHAPAR
jgi:hypothetical protein